MRVVTGAADKKTAPVGAGVMNPLILAILFTDSLRTR